MKKELLQPRNLKTHWNYHEKLLVSKFGNQKEMDKYQQYMYLTMTKPWEKQEHTSDQQQVIHLNQHNAPVKKKLRTNGFNVDLYQKLKEYQLSVWYSENRELFHADLMGASTVLI